MLNMRTSDNIKRAANATTGITKLWIRGRPVGVNENILSQKCRHDLYLCNPFRIFSSLETEPDHYNLIDYNNIILYLLFGIGNCNTRKVISINPRHYLATGEIASRMLDAVYSGKIFLSRLDEDSRVSSDTMKGNDVFTRLVSTRN